MTSKPGAGQAVFIIRGFHQLFDDESSIEFMSSPKAKITLTTYPEFACKHFDRAQTLLIGLASGNAPNAFDPSERAMFESKVDERGISRRKKFNRGVFLVFEGRTQVKSPCFEVRKDTDDFSMALDAFPKDAAQDNFQATLENAIAAISLEIDAKSQLDITKMGDILFLVEPESKKPIYCFNVAGGEASAYIIPALRQESFARAQNNFRQICLDNSLTNITNLLSESLESNTDKLQSFIAIWAALEIFINVQFKKTYRNQWFSSAEALLPHPSSDYLKRVKAVMSDKERLIDKFVIIASTLDNTTSAHTDIELLKMIKSARDELFHASKTQNIKYPIAQAQMLLQKYLGLHLNSKKR